MNPQVILILWSFSHFCCCRSICTLISTITYLFVVSFKNVKLLQ